MTAIKEAVEFYKGVWPEMVSGYATKCIKIGKCIQNDHNEKLNVGEIHGLGEYFSKDHFTVICNKQQFEDCVKETKMKEPKFKSVPVTDMDIWDLGKAVAGGGEFYDDEGCSLFVASESIQSNSYIQESVAIKLKQGKITTRQPIPWYEVEGVFPCLARVKNGEGIFILTGFDGEILQSVSDGGLNPRYLEPLTPAQAAEYGVG